MADEFFSVEDIALVTYLSDVQNWKSATDVGSIKASTKFSNMIKLIRNNWKKRDPLKLDLSFCSLETVPLEIFEIKFLQENLTELSCYYNFLKVIPLEIYKFKNLICLSIGQNELTSIPVEIGCLSNLKTLSYPSNKIITTPNEIINLKQLEVLDIQKNGILSIPPEIGYLENLKELNISGNFVEIIPPEIARLSNLRVLDFSSNCVKEFPYDLAFVYSSYTTLEFLGNPFCRNECKKIVFEAFDRIVEKSNEGHFVKSAFKT